MTDAWHAPIVLTAEEARELRRILDDPTARAPGGARVPIMTTADARRWREAFRNIPEYSAKPAGGV